MTLKIATTLMKTLTETSTNETC